ncbi:hypothetical protein GCM10008101_05970 [Lysobacter xinjiangensis]|uniref:Uncharacterized protein n=1 Tax=Cognatilysobacter xinjiangensis TaxID=546892 RepID=A0ABQ3BRV8_9GAMM|nr:hypothetical protein GCM10008101_05970 [Lysobacter xinjiangensis]
MAALDVAAFAGAAASETAGATVVARASESARARGCFMEEPRQGERAGYKTAARPTYDERHMPRGRPVSRAPNRASRSVAGLVFPDRYRS